MTMKIEMSHSWQQSIDLIKGMDLALSNPGEPGVFGMSQTQKTFDKFKESVGSKALIGLGDIPRIAKLSASDRSYLVKRFWESLPPTDTPDLEIIPRGPGVFRARPLPFPIPASRKGDAQLEKRGANVRFLSNTSWLCGP